MIESMISLELPQPLYRRLQRLAELTHRPLEKLVIQALDTNVPPLLDELPVDIQQDLTDLEQLLDNELWQVAQSPIIGTQQQEYSRLLNKQRAAKLTTREAKRLEELYQQANRHMLRKAYANALLKWRGHALPPLPTHNPSLV